MTKTAKIKAKKTGAAKGRTKAEQILGLLGRAAGSSIAKLMKPTGWQANCVRGILSGSLRKKRQPVVYRGRVYRSLPVIAREITGTHQSGPKFSGLIREVKKQRLWHGGHG